MISLPTIECNGCGLCCLQANMAPLESEYITDEMRAELKAMESTWQQRECIWLDMTTMRCRHYELRPGMCRNCIAPGDETCLQIRNTGPTWIG